MNTSDTYARLCVSEYTVVVDRNGSPSLRIGTRMRPTTPYDSRKNLFRTGSRYKYRTTEKGVVTSSDQTDASRITREQVTAQDMITAVQWPCNIGDVG